MADKKLPLVTVVIPAYNSEKVISESIDSILSQTYKNFELLIIDDCSTDHTWEIIKRYAAKDKRIVAHRNEKNIGIGANRSKGIALAQGEYICWQDADDIATQDRVHLQATYLQKHPKVGVVGGFLELFGEGMASTIRKYAENDKTLRSKIFRYNPVAQPASMVRAICYETVGNYDEQYRVAEDLDMLLRIGLKYDFANVQHVVLRYRQDNGSLTRSRLKEMELNALRIRRHYSHADRYHFTIVDYLYNSAQFLSVFLIPPQLKIAMFNRLRNTKPSTTKGLAIASHVALVDGKEYDGIGNVLVEALSSTDLTYQMVRHSIDGRLPSVITTYDAKGAQKKHRLHMVIARPGPLRYISEFLATVWYFTFQKKVAVYVGIDPLNAAATVILKKLHRIETCVFYTPDYSPQRFANPMLNRAYHAIDRYCVRHADEVWCVSSRIQDIRREMGLPDDKNILVPNVPPAKFATFRGEPHDRFALITNGIIGTQLDFEGSIRALAILADEFPEVSFTVIGNGPEKERLVALAQDLGVAQRVHFTGRLSLAQTLALTAKAGIGLALYTGEWAFNEYGDSTKCREFFFFGLPVVSTDTHATVPEIRASKAGVIVKKDVDTYVSAIRKILKNYNTYADASARLGEQYQDIHKRQLLRLLDSHS